MKKSRLIEEIMRTYTGNMEGRFETSLRKKSIKELEQILAERKSNR